MATKAALKEALKKAKSGRPKKTAAREKTPKDAVEKVIELSPLKIDTFTIELVGDSSLVCHRWSEKAKREMLDKQMKKPKEAKKAKDPKEDYRQSLYPMPDGKGYGFPTIAFKKAAVDACSHVDGITKVQARGVFHIVGELVRIKGKPQMREDMVRVGMGTADIRYRGEFREWSCVLTVRYNPCVLSAEQIINLFNVAGFAIGVGEGRPQKDQSWGMFHVAVG